MIRDPKRCLNHLLDSSPRPLFGHEPRPTRTALQLLEQRLLLGACQFGWPTFRLPAPQLSETAFSQLRRPITDRRSADTQAMSDFSLRQLPALQQPTAHLSALFHLFTSKACWFPCHTRIVKQLLLQGIRKGVCANGADKGWLPRDRTQSHSEARGDTLATGPFAELGLSGEFPSARGAEGGDE